jgi:hypothetical protein
VIAELGQFVRIEPDPHRVSPLAKYGHVADARQPLQRVHHLQIRVVADVDEIDGSVRRI